METPSGFVDEQFERIMRLCVARDYYWTSKELLVRAMIHSSYGNRHGLPHNERLEFLGDSVLDLVMAQRLFLHTSDSEGQMSQERARRVCTKSLARIARACGVDDALIVDDRDHRVRESDNVLADALEALVGALYVDTGFDLPWTETIIRRWGII